MKYTGAMLGQKKNVPTLDEFLSKRDYVGAISLLDFNRNSGKGGDDTDMWLGYAAFHASDHKRALLEFEALTQLKKVPKDAWINLAW